MLDVAVKESEARSWGYVIAGALVIFCTIPVARAFREAVRNSIGLTFFLYLSFALVLLGGYLAVKNLGKRNLPPGAYLCLFAIFALFSGYLYALRDIPEEAIHLAEYGLLGLLVYRALTHRIRDYGIYLAAALVVGMIGIIDEYIQWLTPSRYFDLRDIRTNFAAGALAQAGIISALRPRIISGLPGVNSWRRLCYLGATALALLALAFVNTPQRIAWYASQLPALVHLMNNSSVMVEYGYRYEDPDIGVFRSRFSKEQLQLLDRERGDEVAGILDRYINGEGYRAFQSIYTVPRDAYAHEAGVHLFRREFHLDRAREKNAKQGEHYAIALRENLILARYFTRALKFSTHYWSLEVGREVSTGAAKSDYYESAVSQGIITRLNEWQVISLFAFTIAVLLLLATRLTSTSQTRKVGEK